MITVETASQIILEQIHDYGSCSVPITQTLGRTLAEDIIADRDIPATDRATMDGIAICLKAFENGIRRFRIASIQGAGEVPQEINNEADCIEIMTGASLSDSVDVVVPYEDIEMANGFAIILSEKIKNKQNIHRKGSDRKVNEVIAQTGCVITPDIINAAAYTGYKNIEVKKLPRVIVISSGDELVDVDETPPTYKIRRSNSHTLKAALAGLCIDADLEHLPDNKEVIAQKIGNYLNEYDVIILSGGVSKGKYDYISAVLEELSVKKLFHRIKQKPGKPFWFGVYNTTKIFAFPGNTVSTFLCFHRYLVPWLNACLGNKLNQHFAILDSDISFEPDLQYFLQVQVNCNENGQLIAKPIMGNGSGDLVNLTIANAFMELPAERNSFKKGEVFKIWPFKPL